MACVENKVFKLYTIGDCYVVFGVTDINNRSKFNINLKFKDPIQEAVNVIKMGFEMISIINEVKTKDY